MAFTKCLFLALLVAVLANQANGKCPRRQSLPRKKLSRVFNNNTLPVFFISQASVTAAISNVIAVMSVSRTRTVVTEKKIVTTVATRMDAVRV